MKKTPTKMADGRELIYYDEDESKEKLWLLPPPHVAGRTIVIVFRETIADTEAMSSKDQDDMMLHAEYLSRLQLIGADPVSKVADVSEDKKAALAIAQEVETRFRSRMQSVEVLRS